MTARLLDDMTAQAAKADSLATGYAMAGERELAGLARSAASRLASAAEALAELTRAEVEAHNRELEA